MTTSTSIVRAAHITYDRYTDVIKITGKLNNVEVASLRQDPVIELRPVVGWAPYTHLLTTEDLDGDNTYTLVTVAG